MGKLVYIICKLVRHTLPIVQIEMEWFMCCQEKNSYQYSYVYFYIHDMQ